MAGQHRLVLSGGGTDIDLYSWLNKKALGKKGVEALAGIVGFGFPEQRNRWFRGAGDGAIYRGSRQEMRSIDIPLIIEGENRTEVLEELSRLAHVLNPRFAPARLSFALPDEDLWFVDVVREGGADWPRNTKESDNRTFVKFVLSLSAGDPYWTRQRSENFTVRQDESGRGLLPELAELKLSDAGAFGELDMVNIGDADSYPVWRVQGPFESLGFTGPGGEELLWAFDQIGPSGTPIAADNGLVFDTKFGTVKDFTGANRYDGLAPAPMFWAVPPGTSRITVQATGTSAGTIDPETGQKTGHTEIVASWRPRRWLVF